MEEHERCKKRVSDHTGFHFYRCKRRAGSSGFCGQHDPAAYADRMATSRSRSRSNELSGVKLFIRSATVDELVELTAALQQRTLELQSESKKT